MNIKFVLCVLGMILIIEGLPYFAFPQHIKSWLKQVMDTPEHLLRIFGFAAMALGLGLVYLGRL